MNKKMKMSSIMLSATLLLAACGGADDATNTYEIEVDGYADTITVATTMNGDEIEKVEVLEHNETDGIGSIAVEEIPAAIVASQSLGVDVVTGATITSDAILEAVEQAAKEAGADVDALKSAEVEEVVGEEVNEETDVVVIGGGGAGLSAAISAARGGANVILLEKTSALGGNTVRAGGPYNAVDPERQAAVEPADQTSMARAMELTEKEAVNDRHQEIMDELKEQLEAYEDGDKTSLFDSEALHKLQTYDGGDYLADLEFVEKLVDDSYPTLEWMEENGVEWTDDISTVPGGLWPRAHLPLNSAGKDYIDAGEKTATELGVEILYNSPAEALIEEDGQVVGVKGTSNNAAMEIKAKVVIVATGGFAGNPEMRKEYDPTLAESLPTTNSPAVTGDGIKMAEELGANLVGMEFVQSLPLGNPADGGLNAWMGGSGVEYYYQINKAGERFTAEDGRRDVMTAALLEQEDSMSYVITGGNNTVEVGTDDGMNIWGDDVDELVEKGIVFKADTIEDLAEQLEIDPEVLKETHETFNSYTETGVDEDYGRTLFGEPVIAPFFASARVPTVHHTMGGLQINMQNEVLDSDGNPIKGLLAAGEVTGGIHGANRLGGNALVDIHVFGRAAGEHAAKLVEEAN